MKITSMRVPFGAKLSKLQKSLSETQKLLIGTFKNNIVEVYWWEGTVNFGDLITPLLLTHYGFTPILRSTNKCNFVSTGSILEHLHNDYSGIIFGSGLIKNKQQRFEKAKIIGVRGKLTKQLLGISEDIILGDPGLLASRFVHNNTNKKYALGIVPHYMDIDNQIINNIKSKFKQNVSIINVKKKPELVFNEINNCEHIISSSLHGIITADSLNIPSAWVILSGKVAGSGFKFYDYHSAINEKQEPITLTGNEDLSHLISLTKSKDNDAITEAKEKLHIAFSNLGSYLDK